MDSQKQQVKTKEVIDIQTDQKPSDFEEAIGATRYGAFNFILLMAGLPCCIATVYETSTMSYVVPSAECDLKLSLMDKGVLNAITYAGMITAAIPWGYVADILGRRKLLVYGYMLDFVCVLMCSLTQNVWTLMVFKYLGGFIMCGPFAVLMSYISEFHGTKYRSMVMLMIGIFFSVATISLPAIAWVIIPQTWSLQIGTVFTMKSWQMFLAICSVPSLIAGSTIFFLPESPKFLMSQGRNEEAMMVFRMIYKWNTGNSAAEFPVKELVNEPQELAKENALKVQQPKHTTHDVLPHKTNLMNGLSQMLPLLRKPLLGKCLLVLTIQFCALLGLNTMRLWLPQLFTMVSSYEDATTNTLSASLMPNDYSVDNLCSMIAYSVNKSVTNIKSIASTGACIAPEVDASMYMNTMYVGLTGLVGYVIAGALINACGSKNILIFGLLISGACGLGLYWATNSLNTLILTSWYVSVGSICSTALVGVIVNMFPTSLRTMTISLTMMFGRLGALIGNLIFPYLLSLGCLPPFLMVGSIMLVCSILCTALPKTNKVALK